jgi:hypothetical protein
MFYNLRLENEVLSEQKLLSIHQIINFRGNYVEPLTVLNSILSW